MEQLIRDYFENLPAFQERPFELRKDDSVFDSGLLDSVGVLDLLAHLEETFGFEADPDDLIRENFESIRTIEQFLVARTGTVSSHHAESP